MTETETKWSERVRDWRASGESAEQYADGRGYKGSTLRFWASNLRRVACAEKAAASPKPSVRMVRVVPRSASSDASVEVIVGAARVVVHRGFDGGLLRQVIAALQGEL
jgi:transposase